MTRYVGILAFGLLAACGGDKDDSGDTDTTGTDPVVGCQNEIVDMFPADASADVYYRTSVEFTLETVGGSEAITVTSGGADVAGSTSTVDNRVIFTPNDPLAPSTTYDVSLDWECGPTAVAWTTSAVGAPVDEAALEGNAYVIDLASGRFVQPAGVGELIKQQLDQSILIGVTSVGGGEIGMMGALADTMNMQDMCTPSIDFPVAADFSENPFFSVGPDTTTLNVSGIEITIDDLVVSGAFSADGTTIEGAVLAGAIDTRPLATLVNSTDEGAVCELVATFGVACEPCGDGEPYCLSIYVDSMVAELAAGVTLEEVTEDDVAANPDCATE